LTESGLAVYIWTVDDETDMRKFIGLGVDGIITNKPDLLNSVIRESAKTRKDPLEEGVG
jgi:glycerophosphoryl diester phosphodiesterase